jgi:hydrogenase maturation protease
MSGGGKVVVIGLGNLLCSDDGAGVAAVRLLRRLGVPRGVALVEGGTPGLGLLDLLAGYNRAILVDAVVSGAPPGTVHRFTQEALPPRDLLPLSLHGVNAVDALAMGQVAVPDELPPVIEFFGVEIADRTPGRQLLSPAVAVALPVLAAMISHELSSCRT